MTTDKTLAERVEDIRECVASDDYFVTFEDVEECLNRISELENENIRLNECCENLQFSVNSFYPDKISDQSRIAEYATRISELEATNEGLKIAIRSLSETRSDACRLLPLADEPWRSIAAALQEWKDEEISTNKLREIIVMELRDLDVDR